MDPRSGPLKQKTSFYYPLLFLPREKRAAMEALYRFCWTADEIADRPGLPADKEKELERFKSDLKSCLAGKSRAPLFANLYDAVRTFHMTPEPLFRLLKGAERDLKPVRFRQFQELHRYALQVAGGPGLSSMEIFGYHDEAHRSYAENLGVFLQIVNIVRDFQEDQGMRRQYLPEEDFLRFHLRPERADEAVSNWKSFVEFELDRAWGFLETARKSLSLKERGELVTAEAIAAVYLRLYQKLRNHPQRVLEGKVRLSMAEKLLSAAGAAVRCALWRRL